MALKDLRDEIAEEVGVILASDFDIEVVGTETVPHSSDPAITFPNLDAKKQRTKLIDTCVLYIDIRRSTQLNLAHRPKTVAKLYSAFVRAMTRCARNYKGHVRGIIGDRVMVIFDRKDAFVNAVQCAIAMNTISQHVINRHFTHGEVECGIGIDAGKMLVTKTGVRRKGVEQAAYRNLVWLGRPANVASKLTDLANKPEESYPIDMVRAGFRPNLLSSSLNWRDAYPFDFIRQLSMDGLTSRMKHADPNFASMHIIQSNWVLRAKTNPILMTETVWFGYKAARPEANEVVNGWFKEITIKVPGYDKRVFSGDVIYPDLKS